jgi:hypothetical protein
MATDPVIGKVNGPVNVKTEKDHNGKVGTTSGGVPVTVARTRTPGPRNVGGNTPSATKPAKRKESSDKMTIPSIRPKMEHRRPNGPEK